MIDRFIELVSRTKTFDDKNAVIRWARNQKREEKNRVKIELTDQDMKLRDELIAMLSDNKKETKKAVKSVTKSEVKATKKSKTSVKEA